MEQKYLIWLAPKMEEEEQKDIEEYNERLKTDNRLRLAQGGYTYRIVRVVKNNNPLVSALFFFIKIQSHNPAVLRKILLKYRYI